MLAIKTKVPTRLWLKLMSQKISCYLRSTNPGGVTLKMFNDAQSWLYDVDPENFEMFDQYVNLAKVHCCHQNKKFYGPFLCNFKATNDKCKNCGVHEIINKQESDCLAAKWNFKLCSLSYIAVAMYSRDRYEIIGLRKISHFISNLVEMFAWKKRYKWIKVAETIQYVS